MGTNFYWHDSPCAACGRDNELHVGKRSAGWSFGFRGYRHNREDGQPSPVGYPITSRAEWLRVFTTRPGVLVDEYGQQIDDPVAWLMNLEAPSVQQRRNEDSPQWRGPHGRHADDREWRDAEGFRFYSGEFS